jgi:imidazole glycerol-phosphate synthase subunit HisF
VLLLDRNWRLVKTVGFGARTYIGDPFNVIRLFNECEVDEICVLDIDAERYGLEPQFDKLKQLASECFMPLSYGGGLRSVESVEQLNRWGIEKFVLRSHAHDKVLVNKLVQQFGSQALLACLNYRGFGDTAVSDDGKNVLHKAVCLQDIGFGELILQSVDRDGMREGYDLDMIGRIANPLSIPLIALGGAGTYAHLASALQAGAQAAASGSAFCFVGRQRAVLVNYPRPQEAEVLVTSDVQIHG